MGSPSASAEVEVEGTTDCDSAERTTGRGVCETGGVGANTLGTGVPGRLPDDGVDGPA